MGWLFSNFIQDKTQMVERLNNLSEGFTLIESRVVGNHHWQLIEVTKVEHPKKGLRFIALNLLAKERNGGWGYKDMDETAHPYYYDCPLSLLRAAGNTDCERSKEWRYKVYQYHDQKASKKAKLQVGSIVTLGGHSYKLLSNLGRRGWSVVRTSDNAPFRLPCSYLKDVTV